MSLSPQSQKSVDEYLARLELSLSAWSASDRADMLAEVRSHFDEALTRMGRDDEEAVAVVLRKLGKPEEYAGAPSGAPSTLEDQLRRLERLTGISATQLTPGFDPARFLRILSLYAACLWVPPVVLMIGLVVANFSSGADVLSRVQGEVLGLRLMATNGTPNYGGFAGVGIISVGGLAIGLLALGGGAIGVVAIGGGAVGVVAIGGGAFGLVALGGGSCGYVALGGDASGVYTLARNGYGRFVFDCKRQDVEAVRFFCRFMPRLRSAFAA